MNSHQIPGEPSEPYRILIVDDRPENLITLENIIERKGRKIYNASSGNEALKMVLKQPVDLIMLDIQMPDMDGYETADLLRINPKTKHLPIVFVSAFNKDDNKHSDRYEPGTVDFLAKPLDMDDTRQKVFLYEKIWRLSASNTDHSRMQEKMSEELEQFIYSVSHDVKAPLRAIANLTSWIEEEIGSKNSETLNENITLLKGRVMRTQKMLEGITDFSRASTIYETDHPFKPQELIQQVINALEIPRGFKVQADNSMPEISNGKNKLKQIFNHLVINAIRHHDKNKGLIRISCLDLEDMIQFTVTDDGPGIPAAHHQTVFELFQTLRPKDETDTVGAGLAIVRKIIDSMGGKIWIDDTVKTGTTVHFTWKK